MNNLALKVEVSINKNKMVSQTDQTLKENYNNDVMKNKKGISSVVATVSLILLTFAAVVIVAGFVVPFVRDNLDSGSECFPYRDYFTFEEEYGYNCYNITAGEKSQWVSVRTGSIDEEKEKRVIGFKLSFVRQGGSDVVDIDEVGSANNVMMLNGSSALTIPKSGEVRTYIYAKNESFSSVEIFPKLEEGKVCAKSDSIKLDNLCG